MWCVRTFFVWVGALDDPIKTSANFIIFRAVEGASPYSLRLSCQRKSAIVDYIFLSWRPQVAPTTFVTIKTLLF